jgi:glycosyltransferase involved in cell wall biosynthesis
MGVIHSHIFAFLRGPSRALATKNLFAAPWLEILAGRKEPRMSPSVTLIVPVFNEQDNIQPLYQQLRPVMDQLEDVELVIVDDGSTDATPVRLQEIVARDRRVVVVQFRRNYGQTAAMQAGLEQARGEYLVTLDGDLQNDPQDIPMMLKKLDQGYDLVHGWRKERQDTFWTRRLPSMIANRLISAVTRFPIHDLGCTLKAMRREIADELELYGEMHRFIPILAHGRGARCVEVETHHRPRIHGKTKYGLSRTLRVVLDLITVKYLLDYSTSPMKFFGRIAVALVALAMAAIAAVIGMKVLGGVDMTGNPLLLLGVMSGLMSIQALSIGLLGEASTRLYYSRNHRRPFAIRNVIGGRTETIPMRRTG